MKIASEKDLAQNLIEQNSLCVLATASKSGTPEAATIEYAEDEENNFYFTTKSTSRKYKNIRENPLGCIVITKAPYTLQIEGILKELSESEVGFAIEKLTKKLGQPREIYAKSEWVFMKFIPKEINIASYPKWPSRFEKPDSTLWNEESH